MNGQLQHIDQDRLSVVAAAMLLALALSRLLETPVRPLLRVTVFGSPLGFDVSATGVMSLIILGLAITGVTSLLQSHPLATTGQLDRRFMYWIVPGLLGIAMAGWLNRIENGTVWAAALLSCAALLPFALLVEYGAFNRRQPGGEPGLRWSQMALVHLTAVILFTLIYSARERSLLSGSAVLLVAVLLSTRLFWIHTNLSRAVTYGAVAGLILGQMTWVLNYWRLSGLQGGLLLLLLFYVVVGLIQQFLQGQFGQRIVLEYGSVALIALFLIGLAVP